MTKQESIQYISSLINDPAGISEGDQSSIALFRQKYPYFIPTRYLLAVEGHKKSPWSPAMLSAIQSYTGNQILFQAFLEAGSADPQLLADEQNEVTATEEQELLPEIDTEAAPTESVDEKQEALTDEAPVIVGEANIEVPPTEDFADTQEHIAAPEPTYTFIAATTDNPFFTQVIEEEHTGGAEDLTADVIFTGPTVSEDIIFAEVTTSDKTQEKEEEPLIIPIHSTDYFLHQGERVSEDLPEEINELKYDKVTEDEDKSLMVMMSFSEWLLHFKNVSQKQKEELKDRKALRTMWQKEKLAAAMEEENEEIPENVFEMAVNSISNEDGLVSETLADIYIKQGKYDKAIEVYRKLSLRNPQKNVYFARKIDEILKDKQS